MATQGNQVTISSDDLFTVLQAAKAIGVHFATLYRWVEAGKILGVRFGGILFIPKSEIQRLQNDRRATAKK